MKAALGFLAGAVVAAGVVWMSVGGKKEAPPPDQIVVHQTDSPVSTAPAVVTPIPSDNGPATPGKPKGATDNPKPSKTERAATPSKPSPVTVAQNTTPPARIPDPQPQSQPAPVQQPTSVEPVRTPEPAPAPPPPPPTPHSVTVSAGTLLAVRMNERLTTERVQTGDAFSATLDQPLVVDGFVIAEKGAKVDGKVSLADRGGRVKGRSSLQIELTRLRTADGQLVEVRTSPFERVADSEVKRDAAKVGIAAGIGAAIGAIAGGGKGAAIGAGAGGAAGAGGVLATRGKDAEIPVETRISFKLTEPLTLTEKLK